MVKPRNRKNRSRRKSRVYKGKGGFYPSVFGGISGATILTPLAVRQAYRLWNNSGTARKTRKRTRKIRK